MWHARTVGWLGRECAVVEGHQPVATLEFGTWQCGAIVLDGERLEIARDGWWKPKFHLEGPRGRLATAQKPGNFARGFIVQHGDEEYRLDPTSWHARVHRLTHRGRDLGQIRVLGFLARNFEIELHTELAPELRLFAFWLVLLGMRRAAAAAATG
jgi:hypothetical protein